MTTSTRAIRPSDIDVIVVWGEGQKPVSFPHVQGTLFFAKGDVAWVKWDGTATTTPVARKALRVQK